MLGLIRKFAQWPWPLVRSTEEAVSNIWAQFRFADGEAINEVTETPATLHGTTVVKDDALYTPTASSSNYMSAPPIVFGLEDFCIKVKVTANWDYSFYHNVILGCYNTGATDSAWLLFNRLDGKGASGPGVISFSLYGDGIAASVRSVSTPATGSTFEVEVSRVSGILRMFIDGKLEDEIEANFPSRYINMPRLRTNVIPSSANRGYLDDIQIKKGEGGHTEDFTPTPLLPYVRPAYSLTLAAKVAAQYGFRRNSLEDEAGNGTGKLFGTASVANGRISQTSSTANYFQLPIKKFGADDFTIELNMRISAVHTSYGAVVLGHWKAGSETSDDNRWCVWVGPTGQVSFQLARSATAGDRVALTSVANKILFNVDHHVVVERIGQRVTIYVDGVEAASSEGFDFAVRGAAPFYARSLSTQPNAYTMAGSVWNIRIADTALYKGNVVEKPTFPSFVQPFIWPSFQLTKAGASSYDEVTGHDPLIAGSATIVDGTITTVSATTSRAEFGTITFDQDEDFTVESKFNAASVSSVGGLVIGVWNTAGQSGNSWNLHLDQSGKLSFTVSADGTTFQTLLATNTVAFNTDNHVAVVRKGGIIQLFVNGVQQPSTLSFTSATAKTTYKMSTGWAQGWMNGKRWDLRIIKGRAEYSAAFTPKALVPFYRPMYALTDAGSILNQVTFRENVLVDEATTLPVVVTNNTVKQGRYSPTVKTYNMEFASPTVLDGDFTIEFMFNVSTMLGTTSTAIYSLLGRIDQSGYDWLCFLAAGSTNNAMSLKFTLFRSDGASRTALAGDCVPVNVDTHVVLERVDGTISLYVDGVMKVSFAESLPIRTTANRPISAYSNGDVSHPTQKQLWNIRIASKALYKGAVKRLPSFPRMLKMFAVQAQTTSVQALEPTVPNKVLTDHNIQNTSVQVLESQPANKILTDHNVQNLVVQALVKI